MACGTLIRKDLGIFSYLWFSIVTEVDAGLDFCSTNPISCRLYQMLVKCLINPLLPDGTYKYLKTLKYF